MAVPTLEQAGFSRETRSDTYLKGSSEVVTVPDSQKSYLRLGSAGLSVLEDGDFGRTLSLLLSADGKPVPLDAIDGVTDIAFIEGQTKIAVTGRWMAWFSAQVNASGVKYDVIHTDDGYAMNKRLPKPPVETAEKPAKE